MVGRAGGGGARPSEPEEVLMWAATAKQNSEYTQSRLMVGVAVQRGLTCSDAGCGAQVKSVKQSSCSAHKSCSTWTMTKVANSTGVAPAMANRTGHCNRSRTTRDSARNRITVHCLHRLYRLTTSRLLLRSCAVSGHLESGERTGITTWPEKINTPNGMTFPSRRCAQITAE